LKKPTMLTTCPMASLLQENRTLPSKLARRARTRNRLKKAQAKKKKKMMMMIMMMRAPNIIPMRWLSS
jgi:hypothetical protein